MRTSDNPLIASQVILGDMVYDRFVMGPAIVAESKFTKLTKDRKPILDRRLIERHRVASTDYDGQQFIPGWMHSSNRQLSHSLPLTTGCWSRWCELDDRIAECDISVSTAQGYQLHARKKILRLREDSGPIIPHAAWRSVLLQYSNGRIRCVSFEFSNIAKPSAVEASIVSTAALEARLGFELWGEIRDENFAKQKSKVQSRWW